MKDESEMSMMREPNYFFGLQIKQKSDGIFINQAKYTKKLIKKFGLENTKVNKTPMTTTTKLDKDEQGKNIDIKLYHNMISSLLYLTTSRPNIMFNVCLCARFQSCPRESHLIAVKLIIRYRKSTIRIGLWYPKIEQFNMTSYSDADYAGCRVDQKSTSKTCKFLGNCLVSWSITK